MFRAARPDDLDRVSSLLRSSFGAYETRLGPGMWANYWSQLEPTRADLAITFVVEEGEDLIGAARLTPPVDGVATVRAVAVSPDRQGEGLARAIMAEAERRAREAGATSLMLHTTDFMARAKSLYEHLGYQREPESDFLSPAPDSAGAHVQILGYRLALG